jgi:N6-L-threonylcarbamoyladenine synthase
MFPKYELMRHTLSGLPTKLPYLVLGIETSCDDTGVAVVSSNGTVLSNVVFSQYAVHERFGGVVPSLAMDSHKDNIDKALRQALQQAGLDSVAQVDAIAVTRGPGLEICLRVGCRKAQTLAREFDKPFVTVHHLEVLYVRTFTSPASLPCTRNKPYRRRTA